MSEMADLATGLQHVGIPVKNMDDAVHFYKSLGFEEAFRAAGHEGNGPVVFMKLKGLMVELYQRENTAGRPGAIDHIAIDVTDIAAAFDMVQKMEILYWKKAFAFCRFGKTACAFLPFAARRENGWNSARYFETVKG